MTQSYDWTSFYQALCQEGPDLLRGISEDVRDVIKDISTTTDMFWSEGLEGCLAEGAAADDLREGVLWALDQWRENVLDQLEASFGLSLDWEQVSLDTDSPIINVLVEAAAQD